MSREDEFFDEADDPALKAALRRALGRETAPPELRLRVESMLALPVAAAAAKAAAAGMRAPLRWPAFLGQSPVKSLVAAAIAFVAIGFMFYQVLNFLDYPHHHAYVAPRVDFPVAVAKDLVKAHEQTKEGELKPTADAAATALKLTQTEGFNVAALSNAAGWQFKGAQEVAVGDKKGAQLVYTSPDQLASIFSVSAADHCGGGNSDVYHATLNGHPVSGFVQGGIVYAVVVSPTKPGANASAADLDLLVSQVQQCVSAGGMCSTSTGANATTTHTTTSP